MPEYLSPGVYVEEIDTGSKPIEGVSTSTTGMVGMTERGPVNVPMLVTSYGEYTRWFGERLNPQEFSSGNRPHCYLPHAVEGFFTNGGKRVFITRILDTEAATRATFMLHDRGGNQSASTVLLRPAAELTGIAPSPIYVVNVNAAVPNTGTLAVGDRIRVGNGSEAEYRIVNTVDPATHVPLTFPLIRGYGIGAVVNDIKRIVAAAPNAFTLSEDADKGDTSIVVVVAAPGDIAINDLMEIGSQYCGELRFVTSVNQVDATHLRVGLDGALAADYQAGTALTKLNPNPGGGDEINNNTLGFTARAGDGVVFLVPPRTDFDNRDRLIIFSRGDNATRQARRIGGLHILTFSIGAYAKYETESVIQGVTLTDDIAVAPKQLIAAANAGGSVLTLDNRVGLNAGDVLRIGGEYVTIAGAPNRSPGGAAPDSGNVVLTHPISSSYANSATLRRQTTALRSDRPWNVLATDAAENGMFAVVTDGAGYATGDMVRVTTVSGDVYYHSLASNAGSLDARPVTLTEALFQAHRSGSLVAERRALMTVQALDAGAWGNRLRVSVEDEPAGIVSRTRLAKIINPTHIQLSSATGVEAGTILEFLDNTDAVVGVPVKVEFVDRTSNYTITLAADLTPAQQEVGLGVRSREFRIAVRALRQPDPAMPSRNETILDTELFRHLSMDPRHSRYIEKVIGTTWVQGDSDDEALPPQPLRLADRRSEGESRYVRVYDLGKDATGAGEPDNTLHSIRLGPETLFDILPDGRQRAARHPLMGGDDSVATIIDDTYIGDEAPNPEERTGLQSLRNIEEISLVAIPGQTTPAIQQALIDHCELMRYRFTVLDGPQPPSDSLNDVQTQRQQFDTKYAALYHPWLLIPHPYPDNLAKIRDYSVPPSGHMIGIYARTDVERGVHKAPANEVVRGVTGLQRILNKGEHDILNPYPVNINVIRDFRTDNRGIRVWGGRVITSDPDWKYVNVRRLLIFIEHSIDRGLQWVVFEPNAEPLWARVRRTISNFLTVVWRNGALEGTTKEEAFFVKCDRTTMTQTDIDNGRLICVIGVAPVKPAEFVIIRIGLWTAHAED